MSGWVAGAVAVGTLGAGYLGAQAAGEAASTSAAAADRAAALSAAQYQQSRQDLAPYRDVATGRATGSTFNEQAYNTALDRYNQSLTEIKGTFGGDQASESAAIEALGNAPSRQDFTSTDYEGGTLNQLAEYGRSQVSPGDYIPASDVPQLGDYLGNLPQIRSDIPEFNVSGLPPEWNMRGDIPEFDIQREQPAYDPNFDMSQDPGVRFRQQEQAREIDRGMAGMGKTFSGNRLEELMSRSGDLASQEYGAAEARNIRNYELERQAEQEGYGRELTAYDAQRQREATGYGRERSIFDVGYQREGDVYSRGLTAYDAARQNEAQRYGRDVDAYGREYGLATDRYNAATGREGLLYGRGVGDYSRAYGQEGDYLNRLASLSNIGQTATGTTAALGANAAANQGAYIQGAGNTAAAAQMGGASAWQSAMGDLTSLGTQYAMNRPQPYAPNYNLNVPQGGAFGFNPGGYGGTGMGSWDAYG